MRKIMNFLLIVLIIFYVMYPFNTIAASNQAYNTSGLNVRNSDGSKKEMIPPYLHFYVLDNNANSQISTNVSCSKKWYKIQYNVDSTGFVCGSYVEYASNYTVGDYDTPWSSPKKAIIGGAKLIGSGYINAGQKNSYLKKWDFVGDLYSHQYMTNIRAPYYEAVDKMYSAYINPSTGKIDTDVVLNFYIPVFNSMPSSTLVSGKSLPTGTSEITDSTFESSISAFPNDYKDKLRYLHSLYPNWKFEAFNVGNWDTHLANEISKSCVETSSGLGNGSRCGSESSSWQMASSAGVAYYMDPRNFLSQEAIFMFQDLSYKEGAITESMVQVVLNGTFMSGKSNIDNQLYASIYMEAGKASGVNPVYLASLTVQENGRSGSVATSGAQFNYYGVTYNGLYNFYNYGAGGGYKNPVYAGIIRGSGGNPSYVTMWDGSNTVDPTTIDPDLQTIVSKIDATVRGSILKQIPIGTSSDTIINKMSGITVSINKKNAGSSVLSTGDTIVINNGTTEYNLTISIAGDASGDGNVDSADLLVVRQYLLGMTSLEGAYFESANVINSDNTIDSADLLRIRQHLLGINTLL